MRARRLTSSVAAITTFLTIPVLEAQSVARVADLTVRQGVIPRRLVGTDWSRASMVAAIEASEPTTPPP